MIKKTILFLICVFLMSAVFIGCAANNVPAQAPPETLAEAAAEAITVPEVQIETRSVVQRFLDEYGDDIRADFGELAELFDEGASIDIIAGDGEEFIFIFAYGPDSDAEVFIEELEAVIPLKGAMFEIFAAQLQYELDVDELIITVRYEDYHGNVVAKEQFAASR